MILRRAMRAFLRFAFHLFYNPFAFTYDFVSAVVSRGHWRDWTRAAIPHVVGSRILEIPCGTGNLLVDLFAAGYQPIGVDLSPSMLRIAHKKVGVWHTRKVRARHSPQQDNLESKAELKQARFPYGQDLANALPLQIRRNANASPLLVRARVEALPFPPAAYDSIVMTFPPSFVFDPHALAELRRVLDDRGRLIWVDAGRLLPLDMWSRALNRALEATGGDGAFDRVATDVMSRAGFDCHVETVRDAVSIIKVVIATKGRVA